MTSTSTSDPIVLTDSERKVIAKQRRKQQNLSRIKLANSTRIDDVCQLKEAHDAPPERKPSCRLQDNFRPVLNIGEYVKVESDFTSGQNREEGYGFVSRVDGVGPAALFTIDFTLCVNNKGRSYNGIPLRFLTPANLQENFQRRVAKRKRTQTEPQSIPPSPSSQSRSPLACGKAT